MAFLYNFKWQRHLVFYQFPLQPKNWMPKANIYHAKLTRDAGPTECNRLIQSRKMLGSAVKRN